MNTAEEPLANLFWQGIRLEHHDDRLRRARRLLAASSRPPGMTPRLLERASTIRRNCLTAGQSQAVPRKRKPDA